LQGAPARSRFGEWLLAERILTPEQLDEGLKSQTVYGGRLGTNLVEIGYLGLDELAEHLTRFHGLTLAPVPWLESPDPKAIKLVPLGLIRRHKLLPLRLEKDALHVAMLDPADPDHLSFAATAASRPVVPYVLPEIRLLYWLEIHLQIDRHPRFVNLAARLRRTDMKVDALDPSNLGHTLAIGESGRVAAPAATPAAAAESAERVRAKAPARAPEVLDKWFEDDVLRPELEVAEASTAPPATPAGAPAPVPAAASEDDAEEELLLEELVIDSEPRPAASPARASGPVASPKARESLTSARIAELEARLVGAGDRDSIVEIVLELARAHCEVAVLFLVNGGKVTPFRSTDGEVAGRLDGVEVPLGVHSIFAHPAVTGFAFRGSPPEGGIDGRLLETLGRAHIQDLLVQPISIRDRVVNLLYCDNGSSAFGESSIAALGAVGLCAARAYERLILDRKRERRTA
jgi:hypothetical protein